MKTSNPIISVISAVGLSLALVSCIVPYDGTVASTSYTTYDPGYQVTTLPSGYRTEVISGTNYYYYNGNYYRRQSNGYVVVDAPRQSRFYDEYSQRGNNIVHNHADGSSHVVNRLPSGYETLRYQDRPIYRHDNRYYRKQGNGYVVVPNPF